MAELKYIDLIGAGLIYKSAVEKANELNAVSITSTTPETLLKKYTFTLNGATIGTIDIPKDMVVSGGSVVTNPDGKPAGTYIKLTVANGDDLFINASDLIDGVGVATLNGADGAVVIQKGTATNGVEISVNANVAAKTITLGVTGVGTAAAKDAGVGAGNVALVGTTALASNDILMSNGTAVVKGTAAAFHANSLLTTAGDFDQLVGESGQLIVTTALDKVVKADTLKVSDIVTTSTVGTYVSNVKVNGQSLNASNEITVDASQIKLSAALTGAATTAATESIQTALQDLSAKLNTVSTTHSKMSDSTGAKGTVIATYTPAGGTAMNIYNNMAPLTAGELTAKFATITFAAAE